MARGMALLLAVAAAVAGRPVFALHYEGEPIASVTVRGNRTVSDVLIFNKLETREGSTYSEEVVKEDVKRLYGLGYFSNISVDVEKVESGVKVGFIVREKPELSQIIFKGNGKITSARLAKEMSSKPGEALNEKKLVSDVEALRKLYKEEGYPLAKVSYEIAHPQNESTAVALVTIDEGPHQAIKRIRFEGAKQIPPKKLYQFMETKRRAPWPLCEWPMSYLFSKGMLDEEAFRRDLDRLQLFYHSQGYVDMKVTDVEKKVSKDGRYLDIVIAIDEGGLYKVGTVKVKGNKIYDEEDLKRDLVMKPDTTYSPNALQEDIGTLKSKYFCKGYVDCEIIPEKTLNPDTGKIDITYNVKEYEPYYVGRIDIEGNTRTKDSVIRRELNLMPGDVFDELKLQRSRQRLQNTGFFDSVQITAAPGEDEKTRDLVVDVEEGRTGRLSFGAGFSSVDGFIGFAEVAQSNFDIKNPPYFTGGGQKLRLRAELGVERQDFLLSFTEPYLFGRRLSGGFDLYAQNSEYLSDYFTEQRVGGALRVGKAFGEFYRGDIVYRLENVTLDVDSDASEQILSQDGSSVLSTVTFGLTRDTRDSITFPHSGAISNASLEIAGFGGDEEFMKLEVWGSQYFVPLEAFPEHIIRIAGQAGVGRGFGSTPDIPLSERFFLGGPNSIRGFEFRDVGPRDENDEPLGGEAMAMGSIEYTFPLISRIRGAAFFDMGSVYETPGDFMDGIVASVGVGLRFNLPIGPIKLDYGIPVITDQWTEGETGAFSFNVGTIF